jgi:hypothetical protein
LSLAQEGAGVGGGGEVVRGWGTWVAEPENNFKVFYIEIQYNLIHPYLIYKLELIEGDIPRQRQFLVQPTAYIRAVI